MTDVVNASGSAELNGRPSDAITVSSELVFPPDYVVGHSRLIHDLYNEMRLLVRCDVPVLITGETGVGKELIARILHDSSERSDAPFVAVNCAAIPSELLEAEMFGIAKGVATGVSERIGKFEAANGGTLILDEIGEMSRGLQAKLLRVLQEREIEPLGRKPLRIDVRIIAATNADLQRSIDEGSFRSDLFYRIAGYLLNVPSLRDRPEDIPLFIESMNRKYAVELGKPRCLFTPAALEALMNHRWPGNIRELQHEMRRLVLISDSNKPVTPALLTRSIRSQQPTRSDVSARSDLSSLNLADQVRELETEIVQTALQRSRGNQSEAARLLGISRNGLALKMKRLGIEV